MAVNEEIITDRPEVEKDMNIVEITTKNLGADNAFYYVVVYYDGKDGEVKEELIP